MRFFSVLTVDSVAKEIWKLLWSVRVGGKAVMPAVPDTTADAMVLVKERILQRTVNWARSYCNACQDWPSECSDSRWQTEEVSCLDVVRRGQGKIRREVNVNMTRRIFQRSLQIRYNFLPVKFCGHLHHLRSRRCHIAPFLLLITGSSNEVLYHLSYHCTAKSPID